MVVLAGCAAVMTAARCSMAICGVCTVNQLSTVDASSLAMRPSRLAMAFTVALRLGLKGWVYRMPFTFGSLPSMV